MTFPEPSFPLGNDLDLTDEQMEQMAEITPLDIQNAIIFWHLHASIDLINLIDAAPKDNNVS